MIIGDEPGSKADKARKLSLPILTDIDGARFVTDIQYRLAQLTTLGIS